MVYYVFNRTNLLHRKGFAMREIKTFPLGDSVTLKTYTDSRFKTISLSVDMIVPLREETAAGYAILPALVSRASREYPDYTALSRRLSELYGATLDSSVRKFGEYQVLTLSAGGISSRYALNGENMFLELSNLLFSILFEPLKDTDGQFPEDGFEQEKRQLLEMKDSEFNDKITYTHRKCERLLFDGERAGIDKYGSRNAVESLTREELLPLWESLLKEARFELYTLGDCAPEPELFQKRFAKMGSASPLHALRFSMPASVARDEEEQALAQSKLSMAFRVEGEESDRLLFQLVNAVFGGTPSSLLFTNVREKMSLCYYCSSSLHYHSKALFVESGVETENLEQVEREVLNQLRELQRGVLSEEDLLSAKLALCNAMHAVGDSLGAVENWYLSRTFESDPGQTPEQAAELILQYTCAQVCEAAGHIYPAAVFRLKGNGAQNDAD